MTAYNAVLAIWLVGLVLALVGTAWHIRHWRQMAAFAYYLRHASPPPEATEDSIAGGWLRDAVFHLGLRILLVLLALERLTLQWVIPLNERGAFAASPLQLGLAVIFLLILAWVSRWSWLTHRTQAARFQGDVHGYLWAR